MKKQFLLIIFNFVAVITAALAGQFIEKTPVQPENIKTWKFKDKTIEVTHNVPERFYGNYDLPPERLPPAGDIINYKKYARSMVLRPNGSGYMHNYGMHKDKVPFEWGFVVEHDYIMVGRYKDPDVDLDRVHPIIFRYDGGSRYGNAYFYAENGKVAFLPLPYHWPMFKE